jgi:hypothetical protein
MRLDAIARRGLPYKVELDGGLPPFEVIWHPYLADDQEDSQYFGLLEIVFYRKKLEYGTTNPVSVFFDGKVFSVSQDNRARQSESDQEVLVMSNMQVEKSWAITVDFRMNIPKFRPSYMVDERDNFVRICIDVYGPIFKTF